ncbi:MAG TPA: site-2 protease family protein [Solirubrobacteraceae bacterium]
MSWILPALLTFVGIAVLVVLHEFGHFLAAKAVGMRVEKFSLFFGPWLWKVQRGETTYGIATIPLGGYVKISGMNPHEPLPPEVQPRAFFRQPVWKRIVVIAAGPAVNFVLAFLILWVFFSFEPIADTDAPPRPVVAAVTPGTPAEGVLRDGDRILAVDGVRGDSERLRAQIGTHKCAIEPVDGCRAARPAVVTVVREGRRTQLTVTPVYNARDKRPQIGFSFETATKELGAGQAASHSVDTMWFVTRRTVEVIAGIFYDKEKRQQVGSIVGGYEATRRTFEYDAAQAIAILGLISLSLAVINLAPFLPLDGGHIFWALAEKLRGRAISFRTMEKASVAGMMLVVLLFLLGVTNDVERLQDGTFDRIR